MTSIDTANRFKVTLLAVCLLAAPLQAAQAGKVLDKPAQTQNAAGKKPDLEGVWVTTLTSLEDPRWSIADHLCNYYCSIPAFEFLADLLNNARNADRPIKKIEAEVIQYNAKYVSGILTHAARELQSTYNPQQAPEINCKPVGLFVQTEAYLPVNQPHSARHRVVHPQRGRQPAGS